MKLGIFGLFFFGLALGNTAGAASSRPTADIVYSARYYKPGTRPSHYKIWRINSAGSGRVQVTSGGSDDHSPIWLADGKTILFVREVGKTRTLCTVSERGGPVTQLVVLPDGYTFIESVVPNRRSVVYLVHDPEWKLVLFDVATRQERVLAAGNTTAWSPDSHQFYISMWGESRPSAQILDLATSSQLPLADDLGAAVWLDDNTLVAEAFAQNPGQARLVILRADGTKEREVPLPFTWDDDLSPFADNLFAIPGDPDSVLYGRHAGDSTAGPAQMFYRVSLTGDPPTVVAKGRDLAWSADHRLFATGDGRQLAPLDRKRGVWVSPLSVVSLANGQTRTLVQGLVSVEEFDWRLPPTSTP